MYPFTLKQQAVFSANYSCYYIQWQLPSGGNYKTAKPVPVKTTGVIGAGTMGGGIALSLITSGFPCVLVEQNKEVQIFKVSCIHEQFIAF